MQLREVKECKKLPGVVCLAKCVLSYFPMFDCLYYHANFIVYGDVRVDFSVDA